MKTSSDDDIAQLESLSLGDRMKQYESAQSLHLTRRVPVIVRVDGRAFHTLTRGMRKPFDARFVSAMVDAAINTALDLQCFTLGYVQSDEASFLLLDTKTEATEQHFGGVLSKIVSLTAARMSVEFYRAFPWQDKDEAFEENKQLTRYRPPIFDARAFSVPIADVPNYFLWRQQDWNRNSIQMLARAHFSHAECHGKNAAALHEMLHTKGLNWANLPARERNGTILYGGSSGGEESPTERLNYADWLLRIDKVVNGDEAEGACVEEVSMK